MSSGNIVIPQRRESFLWTAALDPAAYLRARYRVASIIGAEETALNMAMEQSAATLIIDGYVRPEQLADWTIRVVAATPVENAFHAAAQDAGLPLYNLPTEVYAGRADRAATVFDIELAIPLRLLAGKPAQLLNIVIGELPRLGFLSGFRLVEADLPPLFGSGPAFGVSGIRARLGLNAAAGPLLCRSMRPAVGLSGAVMARLNRDVLTGGFHLVKDDELQAFPDDAAFAAHLRQMLQARDEAMQATGERKGYIANLICEPWELQSRLALAMELGVDGVLVAPAIQGLGVLPMIARQAPFPVLAHNTYTDLAVRHPGWGIADAALCSWYRSLGADWVVTPGGFGEGQIDNEDERAFMAAAQSHCDFRLPLMPILQGGKHPAGLPDYLRSTGTRDFMLIVASWVDRHPRGLSAGAREFREAVDALASV